MILNWDCAGFLRGIPICYTPDLAVINDLPSSAQAVKKQRRRWTRSIFRLTPKYIGPLMGQALRGQGAALEILCNVLLNPSFSNLFIFLTVTLLGLLSLFLFRASGGLFLSLAFALWALDLLYFKVALSLEAIPFDYRTCRALLFTSASARWPSSNRFFWSDPKLVATRHDK